MRISLYLSLLHGYSGGICEEQKMTVAVHDAQSNLQVATVTFRWHDDEMFVSLQLLETSCGANDLDLLSAVCETITVAFYADEYEFYSDVFYDGDGDAITLPLTIERT